MTISMVYKTQFELIIADVSIREDRSMRVPMRTSCSFLSTSPIIRACFLFKVVSACMARSDLTCLVQNNGRVKGPIGLPGRCHKRGPRTYNRLLPWS